MPGIDFFFWGGGGGGGGGGTNHSHMGKTQDTAYHCFVVVGNSRGTKVEKMVTLAPERYTAGFCMVAKVILWCI